MFGRNNILNKILFVFLCLSINIEINASSDADDDYRILACTRAINKDKAVPKMECLDHCYVMFIKGARVLDSRGFFQDTGSVQEPDIFHGRHECNQVKSKCTLEDWNRVISIYDRCKREEYNLTSNNCCSVAYDAIKAITNQIPTNIENANSSIGTKYFKK